MRLCTPYRTRHSASLWRCVPAVGLFLFVGMTGFGQPYPVPAQVFSNVFGGSSGWDIATGAAVDPDGNVVVVGTTNSPDFPVTHAYQTRMAQPPLIAISGA